MNARTHGAAFVLMFLALSPVASRGAAAADADGDAAVIEAWLTAQALVRTWSATFVQTRTLKALRQPLVSTGQVWFARPNSFRWELGRPPQTLAVRDGDDLSVIYPRLERIERYSLAAGRSGVLTEALSLLDAGFPRDRADFAARFRLVTLARPDDRSWHLELQPASAATRRLVPALRLILDATNFALLANEIDFPDGSRIRNEFSMATFNATLPPDTFRPAFDPRFTVIAPPTR